MDARVSKLEAIAQTTGERLTAIERDMAVIKSNYAAKEDLARLEGSLKSDLHGEIAASTRWFVGWVTSVGITLVAAVHFIAKNVET